MKRTNQVACAVAVALTMATLIGLRAEQPAPQTGFKRTLLQQSDLSAPGREVVQALAEFQPGAQSGRHTHPGEEVAYVLEGALVLEIQGKPPVTKKAGEVFLIPPGTAHNARNSANAVAKVVATYFIEKGKPVATPVQ